MIFESFHSGLTGPGKSAAKLGMETVANAVNTAVATVAKNFDFMNDPPKLMPDPIVSGISHRAQGERRLNLWAIVSVLVCDG